MPDGRDGKTATAGGGNRRHTFESVAASENARQPGEDAKITGIPRVNARLAIRMHPKRNISDAPEKIVGQDA